MLVCLNLFAVYLSVFCFQFLEAWNAHQKEPLKRGNKEMVYESAGTLERWSINILISP
jgi:hypothetical protein